MWAREILRNRWAAICKQHLGTDRPRTTYWLLSLHFGIRYATSYSAVRDEPGSIRMLMWKRLIAGLDIYTNNGTDEDVQLLYAQVQHELRVLGIQEPKL